MSLLKVKEFSNFLQIKNSIFYASIHVYQTTTTKLLIIRLFLNKDFGIHWFFLFVLLFYFNFFFRGASEYLPDFEFLWLEYVPSILYLAIDSPKRYSEQLR